jgi:hypothetical protein
MGGTFREGFMKKFFAFALGLWLIASGAFAAVLQDWSVVKSKENMGTYMDTKGTKLSLSQVSGPAVGEKALRLSGNVVEWSGAWVLAKGDLSKGGTLKFQAKAAAPCILRVCLTDDRKIQVMADVRITSEGWSSFSLPISVFRPTKYPDQEAPKNAKVDLAKIEVIQLQPQGNGPLDLAVGPFTTSSDKISKTGMAAVGNGRLVVQDFVLLGKNAFGTFADKESNSHMTMEVVKDGDAGERACVFQYDIAACGWCGSWLRAGETWDGQDWRGYQTLTYKVYSEEPIVLKFGFNDGNQNAYEARALKTKGRGWETMALPMSSFQLNEYYQPEGAKKGAALDLSRIETFNVGPETKGKHHFKLKNLELLKR